MKKNFEELDLLAKLEAKRAELDKEIEKLKNGTQTLYCEAYLLSRDVLVLTDVYRTNKQREDAMQQVKEDGQYPTICTLDLPFQKVNGKWEPAFEIVPK